MEKLPRLSFGNLGSSVLAAACFGAFSCSVAADDLPRPGTCDPFEITGVAPEPNSQNVPPDVTPTLTFNDFPDPDTIDLSTFVLYTGFFYHTGRYWVDLVERQAFFRPSGQLTLGLGYTVAIRPGIRSLRGCQLQTLPGVIGQHAGNATFRFQTVDPGAIRRPSPLPPPSATYAQVLSVFAGHCSGVSCHLDKGDAPSDPGTCLETPAGGLSLCAAEAAAALLGVPSRQVVRLVLVIPRDSSHSYLLRKIIGAPPVVGHVGVPDDTLTRDDQHVIEDWIDTGAVVPHPLPDQANDGGV